MAAVTTLADRRLSALCLVVLVALAGCAGIGGDGTATETTDGNVSGGNVSEEFAAFGTDLEGDLTPAAELSVDASAVREDALSAVESTDTYQVSSELRVNSTQNNVQRSQTVDVNATLDREREAYAAEQTAEVSGQQVRSEIYLVNGTLYQRSETFARQYGSEWVRVDVSGNQSEQFRVQDELGLHGQLLENGSVTLAGAQPVDGEEAYRLHVRSNESALAEFLPTGQDSAVNLTVTAAVWVSADDGRVLRSEGRIESTVTARGTTVETTIRYTETFAYTDAAVRLPAEAETAVEIGEGTGTGT